MQLKSIGAGFEHVTSFDISLTSDSSEAVLDLAKLKTPPGDYLIAFYGSAVAKYRHHPEAVIIAEGARQKADQEVQALATEATKLAETAKTAPVDKKPEADKAVAAIAERQKAATAALAAAAEQLKQVTATAQPRDIVDIVVSEPIAIRVKPAGTK